MSRPDSRTLLWLRQHVLVWLIPLVVVTAVVLYVWILAHGESELPASPFIYDY
jgi:hypothetical protein